jgi:hypothetical protein
MTAATAVIKATNLGCSLTCKDLEASIRFYRDAVGFAVAAPTLEALLTSRKAAPGWGD